MNFGKYKYDYNYLLMSTPLLVVSLFVPSVFVAFLVCIFCGFGKRIRMINDGIFVDEDKSGTMINTRRLFIKLECNEFFKSLLPLTNSHTL